MRTLFVLALVGFLSACGSDEAGPVAPPDLPPEEPAASSAEPPVVEPAEPPALPEPVPFEVVCDNDVCREYPAPPDEVTDGHPLYGVSGCAPDDLWAVGRDGLVLHYDGSEWSRERSIGRQARLQNVWCRRPDDVHVFTDNHRMFRWDGDSWTRHEINIPRRSYLEAFSFRAEGDAWAASNMHVVHFDGQEWRRAEFDGERFEPRQVWARAADEVYVLTLQGPVLRWDGSTWTELDRPPRVEPAALCGEDPIEHGTHYRGTITAFCGGAWQMVDDESVALQSSLYLGDGRTLFTDIEGNIFDARRGQAARVHDGAGETRPILYDLHAVGDGSIVVVGIDRTIVRLRPRAP